MKLYFIKNVTGNSSSTDLLKLLIMNSQCIVLSVDKNYTLGGDMLYSKSLSQVIMDFTVSSSCGGQPCSKDYLDKLFNLNLYFNIFFIDIYPK